MQQETIDIIRSVFEGFAETSDNSYMFICDLNRRFSRWSKNAEAYFGLPCENMQDAEAKWEERIHPDDRKIYYDGIEKVKKGVSDFHEAEYRVLNKSNRYVVCSCKGKIIRNELGERIIFLGTIYNHSIGDTLDSVTGLLSMRRFLEILEQFRCKGEKYIVLLIGLQNFLQINNLYGLNFGNSILEKIAQLLLQYKDRGVVFRTEGTKFAIASTKLTLEEMKQIYSEIQNVLKYDLEVAEVHISLETGAGIVIADDREINVQAIYTCARYALDHSKKQEHGNPVVLQNDYLHDNRRGIKKVNVVRSCITQGFRGFYLCYQPLVSVKSGKMTGMEALLRWKGDPYGNVSPNEFIPWLEKDPIFYDLGNWILRQAMIEGKRVQKDFPKFQMHVNLAYTQLEREEFRTDLLNIIEETGFPPENLCLELTERCRLLKMEQLRDVMIFFKTHGMQIALDDFGIGFSSLNLLREFPVDCIKIDRSFVTDITEDISYQYLVQAVTECAHNLHVNVCVEGIEDERLFDFISTNFDITTLQGYYFSVPVPIAEYVKLSIYHK